MPADLVVATSTFAAYAVAPAAPHTSATEARTVAAIVLLVVVLTYLARPLDLIRVGSRHRHGRRGCSRAGIALVGTGLRA